jgi:hypothetical protein
MIIEKLPEAAKHNSISGEQLIRETDCRSWSETSTSLDHSCRISLVRSEQSKFVIRYHKELFHLPLPSFCSFSFWCDALTGVTMLARYRLVLLRMETPPSCPPPFQNVCLFQIGISCTLRVTRAEKPSSYSCELDYRSASRD